LRNIQIAFENPGYKHVVKIATRLEPVKKPKLFLLAGKRED